MLRTLRDTWRIAVGVTALTAAFVLTVSAAPADGDVVAPEQIHLVDQDAIRSGY